MTQSSGTPILQFDNVTKIYRKGSQEVHALRGLDLTVNKGEFVAIWGPSGSGKTTVLNLAGALDTPTSGTVKLEGKDLGSMSRKQLSQLAKPGLMQKAVAPP